MEVGKVLIAKTALDGHWRGTAVVSQALMEAGFVVVLLGMAKASEIVDAAVQEAPDIIGLNVGGRVEVVERILDALEEAGLDLPVMAGGTVAPRARTTLEEHGVVVFPPGSSLDAIVATARQLIGIDPDRSRLQGDG